MVGNPQKRAAENALILHAGEHDPFQFEVKINYPFQTRQKQPQFKLEIFFFLPTSLGINKRTYSLEMFYADIHDYLRFITPRMTFAQLLSLKNARSPLNKIKALIKRLEEEQTDTIIAKKLIKEAKIFAAIFRRSLRELLERFHASISKSDLIQRRDANIQIVASLEEIKEVCEGFRCLQAQLITPALSESVSRQFRRVDELMSLSLEGYALQLLTEPRWLEPPAQEALSALAAREVRYRRDRDYQTIAQADENNEGYIYRHALLKKFAASVLFLEQRQADVAKRLEPIAFGLAAAVSMAFATTVTFISISTRMAPLSWSLFTILVLSYVAKDRIKESFRAVFRRWADNHLSDHKVRVIDPSTQKRIGWFEQKFRFYEPKEIPPEIRQIRAIGSSNLLIHRETTEQTFRYAKTTTLQPHEVEGFGERVGGLTDIIRFGMWRFMRRMDEPRRSILSFDEALNEVISIDAVKSYHINVILRLKTGLGPAARTRYQKLRVILNRQGIMRVEEIDVSVMDQRPS